MGNEPPSLPLPSAPYRGIEAFRFIDQPIFAARTDEVWNLVQLITIYRGIFFYGESGAGKSSLINAGLIPALRDGRFAPERVSVQPIAGHELVVERIALTDEGTPPFLPSRFAVSADKKTPEPARVVLSIEEFVRRIGKAPVPEREDDIATSGAVPVLIFDQFEELITLFEEAPNSREKFNECREIQGRVVEMLLGLLGDPNLSIKLVLSFREDYLAKVSRLLAAAPQLEEQAFRLSFPPETALPKIIRGPFESASIPAGHFTRRLSEPAFKALEFSFRELSDTGTINLTEVQIACLTLWDDEEEEKAFLKEREHREAVRRLFGNYLDRALNRLERKVRKPAITALTFLVTSSGTRNIVSEADLLGNIVRDDHLTQLDAQEVLKALSRATRLVLRQTRGVGAFYEISSEFLIPWITEKRQAREKDAQLEKQEEEKARRVRELEDATKLAESERARAEERSHAARIATGWAVVAIVLALASMVALGFSIYFKVQAKESQARAEENQAKAEENQAKAEENQTKAEENQTKAEAMQGQAAIQGLASYLTAEARRQQKENLDLSLLLSLEAHRVAETIHPSTEKLMRIKSRVLADAKSSLLDGLISSPHLLQFARGHEDAVLSVVSRDDGYLIITGAMDGTIVFWNNSFLPLKSPKKQTGGILSLALSANGSTLASTSADGAIFLWGVSEIGTPSDPVRLNAEAESSAEKVFSVASFSPDGNMLVVADSTGKISVWDVMNRELMTSVGNLHGGEVYRAIFSPKGDVIASCGMDHKIKLWKLKSRKLVLWKELVGYKAKDRFVGHPETEQIYRLAFSPDGSLLASGGGDGTVVLWRLTEAKPKAEPLRAERMDKAHRLGVFALAFSLDGKMLATGSADQTILLWDTATGTFMNTDLNGYAQGVYSLAFVRRGNQPGGQLVAGTLTGTLTVWEPGEEQSILAVPLPFDQWVYYLDFNPSGQKLASAIGTKGGLVMTDLDTYEQESLQGHTKQVTSLAFAPDGNTCAAGGADGNLVIWDLGPGRAASTLNSTLDATVAALAYSPNSKLLVTSADEDQIAVWDVASRKSLGLLTRKGSKRTFGFAFSPNGHMLAAASEDGVAALWEVKDEVKDWNLLGTFPAEPQENAVTAVAFSPDGKTLAAATAAKEGAAVPVTLWDVGTKKIRWEFRKHQGNVNRVKFSPDGEILASASEDKTVVLWDVATGQSLAVLPSADNGVVRDIAFSPDGHTLAASGFNMRFWDVNFDSWKCRAAEIAGRDLHDKESSTFEGEPDRGTTPYGLLLQAHQFALRGETEQARDAFARTVKWAGTIKDMKLNNWVAWIGTLDGCSDIVLPACDAALREAPQWVKPMVLDTRGVALAINHKLSEAADDLEAYLKWMKKNPRPEFKEAQKRREAWVAELRAGRNPIDAKALEALWFE